MALLFDTAADVVALPAGSTLLGDLMNGVCQVAHVSRGHTSHGNSSIFGHVHWKLFSQTLNLKDTDKYN